MSLLSLTAYWVVQNFERMSAVVHTMVLEVHTQACTLLKKLAICFLYSWNTSKEKGYLVLRYNGSNMEWVMNDFNSNSFESFTHSLQLVVHDGVLSQRAVSNLLAICQCIVGHFKQSIKASDKLKDIQ